MTQKTKKLAFTIFDDESGTMPAENIPSARDAAHILCQKAGIKCTVMKDASNSVETDLDNLTKTDLATFCFDGNDPNLLRSLIAKYGDSENLLSGQNEEGEFVTYSIDRENGIVTNTYQNNGWVRTNYYDTDGLPTGETYNK